MSKVATLTVQRWGNSLAVRIPAAIARSAKLTAGQPVEVSLQGDEIVVKGIGAPKLSLAQKLSLFDPAEHGGEEMATPLAGAEVL